jgi:hypothetical protein
LVTAIGNLGAATSWHGRVKLLASVSKCLTNSMARMDAQMGDDTRHASCFRGALMRPLKTTYEL